ncbi:MAG: HAMP domain-containing sensor histidine kinase [Coriobacteriales bacterium]|nr:HAMP domain-containing sensor histidine kinase [Coriobacteriales bacterium]
MTLSFAATAVMTAVVLSIVLACVWEGEFQTYTRANIQRMAERTANTLAQHYTDEKGWTKELVEFMETTSQNMPEVGIRLENSEGVVLYDDIRGGIVPNAKGMNLQGMEVPLQEDSVVSAEVLVTNDKGSEVSVGTVTFWSASSDALVTSADSAFRRNSYVAIITAAVLAVLFAWFIGYFVARALSKPIKRITSTAAQIRNGDLTARTEVTGTDEIGRLGETFDDMAGTLERDIKLEHRLTSDVAHELRTPLMAMQATVEAMQDGVMPPNQDNLATVAVEVRRLSRLVDAMLRLSRMENGTTPLHIDRCDVVALASDLVNMQAQLFADNNISLEFFNETGHRKFTAEIDEDLIREALVNLLSNAMRYTPEGGRVEVRVSRTRRDVLISVSDTGIGIAKEDIPRVFSRFWRSDASREVVAGGLGVGLSLTKEIVDRHNGTISVDSEEGVGTTFCLHLPISQKKDNHRKQS